MTWEGAEICYYYNGESQSFDLSNTQFAIITKILGLKLNTNGSVTFYSDETLKRFANMEGNPLRLKEVN